MQSASAAPFWTSKQQTTWWCRDVYSHELPPPTYPRPSGGIGCVRSRACHFLFFSTHCARTLSEGSNTTRRPRAAGHHSSRIHGLPEWMHSWVHSRERLKLRQYFALGAGNVPAKIDCDARRTNPFDSVIINPNNMTAFGKYLIIRYLASKDMSYQARRNSGNIRLEL